MHTYGICFHEREIIRTWRRSVFSCYRSFSTAGCPFSLLSANLLVVKAVDIYSLLCGLLSFDEFLCACTPTHSYPCTIAVPILFLLISLRSSRDSPPSRFSHLIISSCARKTMPLYPRHHETEGKGGIVSKALDHTCPPFSFPMIWERDDRKI